MSENGKLHHDEAARRSDVARQAAVDAAHAKPSGFALAMQEFDNAIEERASGIELPTKSRQPYPALEPSNLPPGVVLLTGPEAERYRALQSAAQAAHEATRNAQTAGAALRDAFAAFCAGAAPTKDG